MATEATFLTQEEVNELPDGTLVEVVWSGGNGPHQYRIAGHFDGLAFVDTSHKDFLDFVGEASPFTTVRLVERPS